MLLEVLNSNNTINVNKKMLHVFGTDTAIYLSVLLYIYSKAIKKDKLELGNYIRVNRDYVRKETSLPVSKQLACDAELVGCEVITKPVFENDLVSIDVEMLTGIVTELNKNELKVIKDKVKEASEEYKKSKSSKTRKYAFDLLCSYIMYNKDECPELYNAVANWIKALGRKFGYVAVTKQLIDDFENGLNKYTDGYLDVALEIIEIATTFLYRDVNWAINKYEKNHNIKTNTNTPRVTEQDSINDEDIEDIKKGRKF